MPLQIARAGETSPTLPALIDPSQVVNVFDQEHVAVKRADRQDVLNPGKSVPAEVPNRLSRGGSFRLVAADIYSFHQRFVGVEKPLNCVHLV